MQANKSNGMDSSELTVQQKIQLMQLGKNENAIYAEPNSLSVMPSANDVPAGIYAFPTASNNKLSSEDDGIYMAPMPVALAEEKSENQVGGRFDMVDMSELRVGLEQAEVTEEIVTPPTSNIIKHSKSTPDLSSTSSEVRCSNSEALTNFPSTIKIPPLHDTSKRYSDTSLQPTCNFNLDVEEEGAYVEAQHAVNSPGYRNPAEDFEYRHSKSVDYSSSQKKTQVQKFLAAHKETQQLKPKPQTIVNLKNLGYSKFVSSSEDKQTDDEQDSTQSSNSQETIQPNEAAYMETIGLPASIYLEFVDDGVAQTNQELGSQQFQENGISNGGTAMGGRGSKNKSGDKKESNQGTKNAEPVIMTTVKGEDGEMISVQLRKNKLPSSNNLIPSPSSPRSISMPFSSPPAPPTPKLSPPPHPGQRPLPPTPLEEKHISGVFEARGSGDGEDFEVIDRKSSMPKDPPPLPPTLAQPPPLPRTASNYAPKLPYRPPTNKLLPTNTELSTPSASPLKKSGKVPPVLPTKPKLKKLIKEDQNEDQVDQPIDKNFLKDTSKEKSPTSSQKLHPIAEMILKRQNNGQSPRLPATSVNSINNETSSTTNKTSSSLNMNKQASSNIVESIHCFSGVGAELQQPSNYPSNTNNPVPQIISSLHKTPMKKPPSIPSKPTFSSSSSPNHQVTENTVTLKPPPLLNKPVSSKPLPSSPKPSSESFNLRSQLKPCPPKISQKPETSSNLATSVIAAKLSSENVGSTSTQTALSKSPSTLPRTKPVVLKATDPEQDRLKDIESSEEAKCGKEIFCNRRKSGYTLHKLQAERLALVDDVDDYTTTVTCAQDNNQNNPVSSQQNNPQSSMIDEEVNEENTYHSIEDPPTYVQNRKLVSSGTSLVQTQLHAAAAPPTLQFKTSQVFNASDISTPSPKKSPRERILSQTSKTGTLSSPKLKPKPRPNVPPPPRPNQTIEKSQTTEEKQKPTPSRPPPPSAKKIQEARKRREVPKIHSERQTPVGSNQSSPSNTKNKFKFVATKNPPQTHQTKTRQLSNPDVSSVNSEEDATYSAIADVSSDSISTGSDDTRLNEANYPKGMMKKKKKNLKTISISVSTFTSKLGRSKPRVPESNSKETEYSIANDVSVGDGRVDTVTSDCGVEEGIYAGIDDSNENNNIYLTSLPASQQANLREIAYAELVHGQTSDEFTS